MLLTPRPVSPSVHRLAASQAVLAPLCGLKRVTFPPRLETVEALGAFWQERVAALANADWEAMKNGLAFGFAYRCPRHAFANDPSGLRPCKQYRVCPFCFALRVELLYENVVRALQRYGQPVELWLNICKEYVEAPQLKKYLEEAERAKQPAQLAGVLGAVTRTTVYPTHGRLGRVSLRQATLLAAEPGTPLPTGLRGRTSRVSSQTPIGLAWAVSRLARYPVGLLTEDATASAAVLNALGRSHLGTVTGLFRIPDAVESVKEIHKYPFAPPRTPELRWNALAEEEAIVGRMALESPLHEQFALRSLQARLGLPVAGASFAGAVGLPLAMHWVGHRDLMPFLGSKQQQTFVRFVQRYAKDRDFALVYVAGHTYWALSTIQSGPVKELPLMSFGQYAVGGYTLEPLGQFAARLRTPLNRTQSPQTVLAAWRVGSHAEEA